jgi:hypothetical protein
MGRRVLSVRSLLIGNALPRRWHSQGARRFVPQNLVVGGEKSRRGAPDGSRRCWLAETPARDRNHSVRPHRNGRREERQVPLHSNRSLRSVNFSIDLPASHRDRRSGLSAGRPGCKGKVFSTSLDGSLNCGYSYSDIHKNVSSAPCRAACLTCSLSRLIGAPLSDYAARPILLSFDSKSILSMATPRT